MTDRELLELAAKAAGLNGYIHEWINGPEFVIPGENPITWNPLTDDGDALRLAVKLKLKTVQSETAAICFYKFGDYASESIDSNGMCRHESTRRAITRAAAEIGKQK